MHRRSRQILKSTRLDVSAELFGYGRKSAALSKVWDHRSADPMLRYRGRE